MNLELLPNSCRLCLEKDGILESIFESPELVLKIQEFTSIQVNFFFFCYYYHEPQYNPVKNYFLMLFFVILF